MWPRFSQGTLLIFSRIIPDKNGSFVLVYLNAIDDIIFREMKELNGKKILVPFNASLFKEIDLQESDKILGVLTEARWRIES
jgi:SOS-response transcriptional repressor LexA